MGVAAEKRIDELDGERGSLDARRSQLDTIEDHLDAMAADGQLSAAELAQLKRELRTAGLSQAALDRLGADVGSVRDLVGKERARVEDQLFDVSREVEKQESLVEVAYPSASDFDKKQHD